MKGARQVMAAMKIIRKSNKIPLECLGWRLSVKQQKKQTICTIKMLQSQNIFLYRPDKQIACDNWECSMLCMTIMERTMTQMLESWTLHIVHLSIIESHHRNMVNHHQIWYIIRLFFQLNATWYTSQNTDTHHYVYYNIIPGHRV